MSAKLSPAAAAYAEETGLVIGDLCDGPREFGDETRRLRRALAVAWQSGFEHGKKSCAKIEKLKKEDHGR